MKRLYIDFGQVYVKCGLAINIDSIKNLALLNILSKVECQIDNDKINVKNLKQMNLNDVNLESINKMEKIQEINQEQYNYINSSLSIIYKDFAILLFSFQKTKLKEFLLSVDYEIINSEVKDVTNLKYSGINDEFCINVFENLFSHIKVREKSIKTIALSIIGIDFLVNNLSKKSFFTLPDIKLTELACVGKLSRLSSKDKTYRENCTESLYPYVLANIIEGNSLYLVNGANNYKRLGGSSFGATTYWSLMTMICGYDDPYQAVMDGLEGDNDKIDLSVGDIYGGGYETASLPDKLIASSFGKIKRLNDTSSLEKKDISRSLMALFCLCNGQIMSLLTMNEKMKKCLVIGNPFEVLEFMQLIQMTVRYSSKQTVEALFGEYNSYLSVIGMMVHHGFYSVDLSLSKDN